MVNPHGDQFFIYAEPLINVYKHTDSFVRIKHKDRKQKQNPEYHQGEIFADIREITLDDITAIKLTLYFSFVESLIRLNAEGTRLLEIAEEQHYYFPKAEFTHLAKSIEAMHNQHTPFTLLMMNTEIIAPII